MKRGKNVQPRHPSRPDTMHPLNRLTDIRHVNDQLAALLTGRQRGGREGGREVVVEREPQSGALICSAEQTTATVSDQCYYLRRPPRLRYLVTMASVNIICCMQARSPLLSCPSSSGVDSLPTLGTFTFTSLSTLFPFTSTPFLVHLPLFPIREAAATPRPLRAAKRPPSRLGGLGERSSSPSGQSGTRPPNALLLHFCSKFLHYFCEVSHSLFRSRSLSEKYTEVTIPNHYLFWRG